MKIKKGKAYLVGGGPGDAGLLTLRGLELLRTADAVIYDGLINPELLNFAKNSAVLIDAGKRHSALKGEAPHLPQEEINSLLLKLTKKGLQVVRLKGGDPFIFGRGGEEAEILKKARVPFEIVPGVSAGYAVPAYAGIPVTDRRLASQVTFVTAHEDPMKKQSSLNWKALSQVSGTLVFFMGVQNLSRVAARLVSEGMNSATPAAMIQSGTLPSQKTVGGTLKNIAVRVKAAGLVSPSLMVVGRVGKLRKKISWFKPSQSGKLSGKTVLVTRARAQSFVLKRALEQKGASVLEFPAIQILPPASHSELDAVIRKADEFDWIIFTSAHGVGSFFRRLNAAGRDSRFLAGIKIAAVGDATEQALEARSLRADFIPSKFTSEGLVRELKRHHEIKGRRFLLPRTDIAPRKLIDDLKAAGAKITQVTAYRTVPGFGTAEKKALQSWLRNKKIDYLTFTSSSTVRNFLKALSKGMRQKIRKSNTRIVSIGPVTSQTLRSEGFKVYREAGEHTMEGLVKAIQHV